MGAAVEPDLLARFEAADAPRRNIAPSQSVFIATLDAGDDLCLVPQRWFFPTIRGPDALREFAPADHGANLETWCVSDAAKKAQNEGVELIEPLDRPG